VKTIQVKVWKALDENERRKILSRSEADISSVIDKIKPIVERVKSEGDKALVDLTRTFDRVELSGHPLLVTEEEFDRAEKAISDEVRKALKFAIENVKTFHRTQRHEGLGFIEVSPGIFAGEKASPVPSCGLYVPHGRGSFPSMLYMLAVPAVVAGVREITVATPPNQDGSVDPACLVAARLCGVSRILRVGGSQAIAALAYGTESVPGVSKIVGPGSMYVAAAKRIVSGIVDTGLPAGPSESIVLADETADPYTVALDLLIESEHGSDSSALLVSDSKALAEQVAVLIPKLAENLPEPRKGFVNDVFSGYGGIILTESREEACFVVNEFAPEHLQIQAAEPFAYLGRIENAGEILLGANVPFSAANYAAGPNAVLPTGGFAKTYSPVSVRDFMKFSSIVYATAEGYEAMKPHVTALADYEGFPAHANAFRLRKR
jgi:histidinol dehydrogenase